MLKKKVLFALFLVFIIVATLSFAYKEKILITKEPSEIYFAAGKYYLNKNDFNNATYYFKKTIELKPDFAEAYHNLGISFYYNKNTDKAMHSLKKAIEIKKGYAKAHYSIALIYYELKDFDSSIFHLSKVTQLEPNNANAHFDLAVAYADRFRKKELSGNVVSDDLQDLREALKYYLKAEGLKPGFSYALSNAKIVESVISEYEQSIGYFTSH